MSLGDFPAVAVHDLAVQPRDKELVVGYAWPFFYKGNVEHLEQLKKG
jgi:hypothetical protein